jgi:hypothetical protein
MSARSRAKYPNGYYSLGAAHGIPGLIGFLGMVHAAGVERKRTREMIAGATRWLMARKIPGARGSSFPCFHPRLEAPPARSSWCYGNPAIATCLLIAARALDDASLQATAHEFALEAAQRPHAETGIIDAGLCHGSAGVAHLLNRDFQATRDERLLEGARAWFHETMEMRRRGTGPGRFRRVPRGRREAPLEPTPDPAS